MRTLTAGFVTALEERKVANCVRVRLKDPANTIYAFTDHIVPLTVDGLTYTPVPGLQKINMLLTSDQEISDQQFAGAWLTSVIEEEDIGTGRFDDADIQVSWVPFNDVAQGGFVMFSGRVGMISYTEDGFAVEVQDDLRVLSSSSTVAYTQYCRHVLGDSLCTINTTLNRKDGVVDLVLTDRLKFKVTIDDNPADGNSTDGRITFTTGLNNGIEADVKIHEVNGDPLIGTSVEMWLPTPYPISAGDTFRIKQGCDKTSDTCKNKFSNFVNFGGFPFIQPDGITR